MARLEPLNRKDAEPPVAAALERLPPLAIFSTVANPVSPLNPFGKESKALRDEVIELYAEVVKGSDARLPDDIVAELPTLLWLYQMGILYFWIFDKSPGRLRTLEVIDQTTELMVRLLGLANLPVLRGSRTKILGLVRSVAQGT